MALVPYDMDLSYDEMSNDEESVADDEDQASSSEGNSSSSSASSSASSSSPENKRLSRTKHTLASRLKKRRDRQNDLASSDSSESSGSSSPSPSPLHSTVRQKQRDSGGKKIQVDNPKNGRKNEKNGLSADSTETGKRHYFYVPKGPLQKTPSRTKATRKTTSTSRVSRNTEDKGPPGQTVGFVPPLKLPKLPKNSAGKKLPPVSTLTSSSSVTVPSTTSVLLSMMAQAVSAPQYTSVRTSTSPTASDFPDCPTRSSWPLLREMIATPPSTTVSISSAPRQTLSTVLVEPVNEEEPKQNVINKLEKEIKCVCKFNKGQPCWLLFNEERLRKERLHHLTLKRESLDLVILAKIAANINREEKTKKHHGKDRQRCRLCYFHEGRQICRETFLFIHGICKGRLCALMKHYKQQGLSVRVHGNKSNIPRHALSSTDSERVLNFIRNYANDHCVSSFGRKPGSKAGGGLLIMSPTQSKLYVHHKYKLWCAKTKCRAVSLRSFQNMWTRHLPYIVVLRGSNKTPVPEPGSHEALRELQEDSELTAEVRAAVAAADGMASSNSHGHNGLKVPSSQSDHGTGHTSSGTQVDFDASAEERKKRKRKGQPPRKVETSACHSFPSISDGDLIHGRLFEDSQIPVHSSAGTNNHVNNLRLNNNSSSVNNNSANNHSASSENIIHSPLSQPDLHHSNMFGNDLHIPISSTASSLHHHPSSALSFHNRTVAPSMMLPANKDVFPSYNHKSSMSVMKTTNLRSTLYLPQPSQLLDTYPMHCPDRYAAPMSGSHALGDQSQPVLLPHQSTDFANMHQLDWQAWQPYSTL